MLDLPGLRHERRLRLKTPVDTTEPITVRFRWALVEEDTCPDCLSDLDEGRECTRCSYDALEEFHHDFEERHW